MSNILISGSTNGLGLFLAKKYSEEKRNIYLLYRNESKIGPLINFIHRNNSQAFPIKCDFSDIKEVNLLSKEIKNYKFDLFINCAGAMSFGAASQTLDATKETYLVNSYSAIHFITSVAEVMSKHKKGNIINISSFLSENAEVNSSSYSASKAYTDAFISSLQKEYSHTPIKITSLLPSLMPTSATSNIGLSQDKMIPLEEIFKTIKLIESLDERAYIKKLVIDCSERFRNTTSV